MVITIIQRFRRFAAFAAALCLTAALLLPVCSAAILEDGAAKLNDNAVCSLRLSYLLPVDGEMYPFPDEGIELFHVISFDHTGDVSLYGDFAHYPVRVKGIRSQSEWLNVTNTLNAYAIADGLEPDDYQYTDEEGAVLFENLEVGMYLVRWEGNEDGRDEFGIGFAPFIISVPDYGADGEWNYNIDSVPKPGQALVDLEEPEVPLADLYGYTVVKQWMDEGYADERPSSITVELYCDGEYAETVYLSDENDWTYSWIAHEPHDWMTIERDVPDNYTVIFEQEDDTFIITNCTTHIPSAKSPKTGVDASVSPWLFVLDGMAVLLILIGILMEKRRRTSGVSEGGSGT